MARRTYQRRLRTRGYELDQLAQIPPHVWLRYAEHLRWETLASGDLVRLFEGAHSFVLVAETLELKQDLNHDVDLQGTMWLGGVGRSSITFLQDFTLAASGETVALAAATGVYLGPDGRAKAVPEPIRALTQPGGRDARFFEAPRSRLEAPDGAWAHELVVRPSDLDLLRHVNHSNYLAYMDDARLLAAADGGYGEASEVCGWRRARKVAVSYLKQAVQGDRLRQATWVIEGRPGPTLGFLLRRGDEAISQGWIELG